MPSVCAMPRPCLIAGNAPGDAAGEAASRPLDAGLCRPTALASDWERVPSPARDPLPPVTHFQALLMLPAEPARSAAAARPPSVLGDMADASAAPS